MNTAQLLTAVGVSVGLAVAGWGLVGQFMGLLAGSTVFYLLLAWDGLRRYPEVVWGPAADPPALWALSWPTLLFNLSGRLSLFTDNILLAAFLGPAAVTPFVLTQRLIQAAAAQVAAVGTAAWAGVIDLHYRGEHVMFARRLTQITLLTGVAGAALLLPVAVWNRDLIGLWVGLDRYAGPAVTWLAAGNAWGLAVLSWWGWPLMAGGRVRVLLPVQLVGAAVNLAASAVGTAVFGPPGPLLGTTVVFAGLSWWWLLWLLRREFGVSRPNCSGRRVSRFWWQPPTGSGWSWWPTPYRPTTRAGRVGRSGQPWLVGWQGRRPGISSWPGRSLCRRPTAVSGSAGSAVGFAAGRRKWSETACQPELFALFRQFVWRTLGTQEADTSNGSCEDSLLVSWRERIVAAAISRENRTGPDHDGVHLADNVCAHAMLPQARSAASVSDRLGPANGPAG